MTIYPHKNYSGYTINSRLNNKYLFRNLNTTRCEAIMKKLNESNQILECGLTLKEFVVVKEHNGDPILQIELDTYETIIAIKSSPNTINDLGVLAADGVVLTPAILSHLTNHMGYRIKKNSEIYNALDMRLENNFKLLHNNSSDYIHTIIQGSLTNEQHLAINNIFQSNKLMNYLIADAGTGKSYSISNAVYGKSYMCIAPTHKAKNVLIASGLKASTIHKLYGQKFAEFEAKGACKTIDLLIIDEVSMIGTQLLGMLTFIIDKCEVKKVIMMGDDKQLQPVGRGSLLTLSKGYHKETLTKNMRSTHKGLNTLIQHTKSHMDTGKMTFTHLANVFHTLNDKDLITCHAVKFINDNISRIITGEDVIIAWTNENVQNINKYILTNMLGQKYNAPFVGELRVITKNGYIGDYFNGDYVKVTKVTKDKFGNVAVELNGITVDLLDYKNYSEPGYATTVHKSQGGSYGNVFFYMTYVGGFFNTNILYTAITRARNSISIQQLNDSTKVYKEKDRRLIGIEGV